MAIPYRYHIHLDATLTSMIACTSLRQLHFYKPSEHHIDGHAFSMEMHPVHQDERSHILVIATMLEVGVEEPVRDQLWKWLPKQIGQDESIPLNFRLADILANTRHFSY